jgi:hypothetical protein
MGGAEHRAQTSPVIRNPCPSEALKKRSDIYKVLLSVVRRDGGENGRGVVGGVLCEPMIGSWAQATHVPNFR